MSEFMLKDFNALVLCCLWGAAAAGVAWYCAVMARQITYAIRSLRQAAQVGADMLDATEPAALVAPDPDVPDHALLLSG